MTDLYALTRPLMFALSPESAHNAALKMMKCGLMPRVEPVIDSRLHTKLWDLDFANPVGLSAGFDKNAEVIAPILNLGFGFTEVGTVTPKPQDGNPKPRVFRDVENEAVINRLGFPNVGLVAFKDNLEKFRALKNKPSGIVGINIGMNKGQTDPASDYLDLMRVLAPKADYLTINISSPNTPGLRDLQKRAFLIELIGQLQEERARLCKDRLPPLLIKLAPDLSEAQQEELASAALDAQIDGLILTNTTLDRPETLEPSFRAEKGGLSGAPVRDKSTKMIRSFYTLTKGQIPIIGVGGISTAEHAYEKIKAGASLVQLYTGMIYQGPRIARNINEGLAEYLARDGFKNISEAVGKDVKI